MNLEQRKEARQKIKELIGEAPNGYTDRCQYRKTEERLMNLFEKYGEKGLSMILIDGKGITPKGKKVYYIPNCGMEIRSRYCGTLYIDGECIFTSGTVAKCFEYMLNN